MNAGMKCQPCVQRLFIAVQCIFVANVGEVVKTAAIACQKIAISYQNSSVQSRVTGWLALAAARALCLVDLAAWEAAA